jgi:hypothetical protein
MLDVISSIPTTVHEGFDVQDLPPRASTLSEVTLENVFGGNCGANRAYCAPFPIIRSCCANFKCDKFRCQPR